MTRYLLILLAYLVGTSLWAQSPPRLTKWEGLAAFGFHTTSLGIPDPNPFHPGCQIGARYYHTSGQAFDLIQQAQLGYFWHQSHQHGIQLLTELAPTFQLPAHVRLTPLLLGGGYQLSILDMPSFVFESSTNTYRPQATANHQWILSIGSQLGYTFGATEQNRGHSLWLSYRLQVQGIVIQETIPTLPYTTLLLTWNFPLPF